MKKAGVGVGVGVLGLPGCGDMADKNSILFVLEDDALIVANTGAGFSRKGVVSICNMDLSAKDVRDSRTPVEDLYAPDIVGSILEKCIEKYNLNINNLTEDANREEGASASYVGRFVWELLQNADDAMDAERTNADLIGTKGIGFKSVLEITNEPEIYSGDFYFHFSRQKSKKILENKVHGWKKEKGVPVCRLPHPKEPDPSVQNLLNEGYTTVLRLPLNVEKKEFVEEELSKFNIQSLLFCQSIEYVEIRINSEPRCMRRQKEESDIKLNDNDKSERWRIWSETQAVDGGKRISVSVCLPVDDGEIRCMDEVPPLYVFFPTNESVPGVHALIHASCEVDDNRKHLGDQQPHQYTICEMLKSITTEVLREIPPNEALRVFGQAHVVENSTMVAHLGRAIRQAVRETAFIPVVGGGLAKPGAVRLWKHGIGAVVNPDQVQDKNICDPEVNNNKSSVTILENLGAGHATSQELADWLFFCRNTNADDCLKVWNVAQLLMKSDDNEECKAALRKAPFWLVSNGQAQVKARAMDGDCPLVEKQIKDLPNWLSVDVLDQSFRECVKREQQNENWKNHLSGGLQPLASKLEYFGHILLPYCNNQSQGWWSQHGWEVIKMAFLWGETNSKDELLIIGSNDAKEKRATNFYLPVGEDAHEWQPAWQCCAGEAWDGPKIFDEYFAEISDRYVLSPMGDWGFVISDTDKDNWKNLLSWLGCSWIPKMEKGKQPHPNRTHASHTQWHADFHFEHFDEIFSEARSRKSSDYTPLLSRAPEIYKFARTYNARYFYRCSKYCDSYAFQQLQKNKWIPCKSSLLYPNKNLFKPSDVYLPGKGLGGFLPEVNKFGLNKDEWDEVKNTLTSLGAKDSISDDPKQLVEYMNQLSKCANENAENLKWSEGDDKNKGKISLAAKAIFSAYYEIKSPLYYEIESPPPLDDDVMVPCLRNTSKGEIIHFKKIEETYWADDPYFNEPAIRRKILNKESPSVFFRFLKDGENFGLAKLSEFLVMKPVYGTECPQRTNELIQRYHERRVGMEKATGQTLKPLEIVGYDNIGLAATAHITITIPEIKFWKKSESEVHINTGSDMWRGLAAALAEMMNCDQYKSDFELLLKENAWEYFLHRLRDDYGLTEESIEEIKETTPGGDDGSEEIRDGEGQYPEQTHDISSTELLPSGSRTTSPATNGGRSPTAAGVSTHPGYETGESEGASHQSLEIPEIQVVPQHDWGPERNSQGGSSGGQDANRDEHIAENADGSRGEAALLGWLKKKFGDENVTNMNEQNPNHPGYDIRVKQDGEDHYYECKSFAASTPPRWVSITTKQFTTAEKFKDRYKLCVIYDTTANPIKMLSPIANPAALEKKPTNYKINLASKSRKADGSADISIA